MKSHYPREDNPGRERVMGAMARGAAVLVSVVLMVVCQPGRALADTDNEGPELVSFTRTPDSVDVSQGPANLVVWANTR